MKKSLRLWIIRKLGGYPDINSAIDGIREVDYQEKYRILTLAVKKLFNTIGADDILRVHETGQWMFKGKALSKGEQDLLAAEATQFLNTKLWEILQADVKYQANRKMFILAKSEIDLIAGKLWEYTLDAFTTRLESMKSGSALFNSNQ
jgi:hypothetical protein